MIRYILLFFTVCGVIFFSGCSEKPEKMNTVRPRLILEIFELSKREKHEEAVVKIRKLREIDQTNVFLPLLEGVESSNAELQKINRLMSENKRDDAGKKLKDLTADYRMNMKSSRTAEKLRDVLRMEQLSDRILSPRPVFGKSNKNYRPASEMLEISVKEFLALCRKLHAPASLRRKAMERKAFIPALKEEEKRRENLSLEAFAPGLPEHSFQTMTALRIYADGTN